MTATKGKMWCPHNPARECLPATNSRKRFCARVADGRCRMTPNPQHNGEA